MKIGINSRIYQEKNTGIQNVLKNIYTEIIKVDRKNEYLFFQTKNNKKLGRTKTFTLPNSFSTRILFDILIVNLLAFVNNVKIFHGPSHILPFFKLPGVKYVLTVHDLTFMTLPHLYTRSYVFYSKMFVPRSLKNADIIIADSNNTKEDIKHFFKIDKKKIKVIYLAAELFFFVSKKKKRLLKDKYFFSITTQPTRKNINAILNVIKLNKNVQKYKYVIAGLISEEQRKELKKNIINYGISDNVILFGYAPQEKLISLYQNAEFFIYPSFYEGFGIPVLEAMACRCPVIASNTSSLVELIPDKKWLIDPYSNKDISEKINNLINLSKEEKLKLLNDNYKFAKKFSWKKTASDYLKAFNSLR